MIFEPILTGVGQRLSVLFFSLRRIVRTSTARMFANSSRDMKRGEILRTRRFGTRRFGFGFLTTDIIDVSGARPLVFETETH
jgi:hypothetical protein